MHDAFLFVSIINVVCIFVTLWEHTLCNVYFRTVQVFCYSIWFSMVVVNANMHPLCISSVDGENSEKLLLLLRKKGQILKCSTPYCFQFGCYCHCTNVIPLPLGTAGALLTHCLDELQHELLF
eukprot:TRINITY_DN8862_c1_g1_i1.p1 TRINITY_DN8862_c1_g1~~TRINITY_DN8862_c1_g1_i1.p1  ORF type:complete len:123 (+),score=12.33 TRINITY_DN8862_c1_g1_i1:298-666(+)